MPDFFHHGVYDHFKGGVYKTLNLAISSESQETMVIYEDVYTGDWWTRPLKNWVEEMLWPDGQYRPRFVYRGPDLNTPAPHFKTKKG